MHVGRNTIYFDTIDPEYPYCPYHRDDVITCEEVEKCSGTCAAIMLLEIGSTVEKEKKHMKHKVISRELTPGMEFETGDNETILGMIPFADLKGFYLISIDPIPPAPAEEKEERKEQGDDS